MPGNTRNARWYNSCYPKWVAAFLLPVLASISNHSGASENELPIAVTGIFFSTPTEGKVLVLDKAKGTTETYNVGQHIPDTEWEIFLIEHQRTYLRNAQDSIRVIIGSDSSEVALKDASLEEKSEDFSEQEKVRTNFLSALGLEAVEKGSNRGYLVSKNNTITQKNGLNKGDVITSLNGYPVGNKASDLAAYKSYKETGTASLEVIRGSDLITIRYERKDH